MTGPRRPVKHQLPYVPPRGLIEVTTSLRDQGAAYSPDGSIAFISDRSGSKEIWLAKGDGSRQLQVTHFSGPPIDHLQWSPNGQMLAFDARPHGYPDIFILECDSAKTRCGEPKPLAMTPAVIPGWSAEGEFIYLASNRTGSWEVWRVAVSGGRPLQVTTNGGYMSRESRDGKWLYFSKDGKDNICSEPAPYLVLDLSGVSFLDSAGVGALVGLFMNRRSIGKKLALAAVAQQGIAILQVSRLVRFLPLYASVDLAVQRFRT